MEHNEPNNYGIAPNDSSNHSMAPSDTSRLDMLAEVASQQPYLPTLAQHIDGMRLLSAAAGTALSHKDWSSRSHKMPETGSNDDKYEQGDRAAQTEPKHGCTLAAKSTQPTDTAVSSFLLTNRPPSTASRKTKNTDQTNTEPAEERRRCAACELAGPSTRCHVVKKRACDHGACVRCISRGMMEECSLYEGLYEGGGENDGEEEIRDVIVVALP